MVGQAQSRASEVANTRSPMLLTVEVPASTSCWVGAHTASKQQQARGVGPTCWLIRCASFSQIRASIARCSPSLRRRATSPRNLLPPDLSRKASLQKRTRLRQRQKLEKYVVRCLSALSQPRGPGVPGCCPRAQRRGVPF